MIIVRQIDRLKKKRQQAIALFCFVRKEYVRQAFFGLVSQFHFKHFTKALLQKKFKNCCYSLSILFLNNQVVRSLNFQKPEIL